MGDAEERTACAIARPQRRREHARRRDSARAGPARPRSRSCSALTLPPSDNFFAETLVKDLGARYGGAGTTAAGAAVVAQTIASLLGIHPRVVDGSGLSEADRTSPYEVADLLVELAPTPIGAMLRDSLAVAGRTGTLATTHAPHRRRRDAARARRARSPASPTSSATARPPTATCSRSRSSTTASRPAPRTSFQDHMAITIAGY